MASSESVLSSGKDSSISSTTSSIVSSSTTSGATFVLIGVFG